MAEKKLQTSHLSSLILPVQSGKKGCASQAAWLQWACPKAAFCSFLFDLTFFFFFFETSEQKTVTEIHGKCSAESHTTNTLAMEKGGLPTLHAWP